MLFFMTMGFESRFKSRGGPLQDFHAKDLATSRSHELVPDNCCRNMRTETYPQSWMNGSHEIQESDEVTLSCGIYILYTF